MTTFLSKPDRAKYFAKCREEKARCAAEGDWVQFHAVRIAYFCGKAAYLWERTPWYFRLFFSSEQYRKRIADHCLRIGIRALNEVQMLKLAETIDKNAREIAEQVNMLAQFPGGDSEKNPVHKN